jgi:2-oxoglutarate ferredoxin oxidoreductase subunit beta
MKTVFKRPDSLVDVNSHYCPGCHHGTVQRMVAEAIDHFGIRERTIGAASVGCSVFMYDYFDVDVVESPHGRAPAVATGIVRANPDKFAFVIQGDGDLAAIGTAEIIHAANRGEKFTVIFVNNTVYGMTGGQMAPTTMPGQRTTTSPAGRDVLHDGYPIKMTEILANLEGVGFAARVAVDTPAHLTKAKMAIFEAFAAPLNGEGLGFVEVLASCPTNWGMDALAANRRIGEEMIPYFPLGTYKERKSGDAD